MDRNALAKSQKDTEDRFAKAIDEAAFHSSQIGIAKIVQEYTFHSQNGILQVALGQLFDGVLQLGRICLNQHANVLPNIRSIQDLYRVRAMGDMRPLAILSGQMYSQWFNYTGFANPEYPGVFHQVYRSFENAPEIQKKEAPRVAKETICWGLEKYRRSGKFFAYRQENDGCIMISDDFKDVYKVLGIGQPIGNIVRNMPYSVIMTILPWCNVLTYDGWMAPNPSRISESVKTKLDATYQRALAEDKIITRISVEDGDSIIFREQFAIIGFEETKTKTMHVGAKVRISGLKNSPKFNGSIGTIVGPLKKGRHLVKIEGHKKVVNIRPGNLNILDDKGSESSCTGKDALKEKQLSKEIQKALDAIAASDKYDDLWVFRRFGYSENENPNHMVCVMESSGTMAKMFQTKKLEPTFDEIVSNIAKLCEEKRRIPKAMCVDYQPIVKRLQNELRHRGLLMSYYPPPSKSERQLYS